jgi:transcription elongation GreA/GreB family factor
MSVAFTREESAETAAEVKLPDRPISPHPSLVTAFGLEALTNAMRESRIAYEVAQGIEDAAERRRAVAVASRDMRYFADRLRTAQLAAPSTDSSAIAFRASRDIQARRRQAPGLQDRRRRRSGSSKGSIAHVSPVARALIGRAAGEIVLVGDREIEILSIDKRDAGHLSMLNLSYKSPSYMRTMARRNTRASTGPALVRNDRSCGQLSKLAFPHGWRRFLQAGDPGRLAPHTHSYLASVPFDPWSRGVSGPVVPTRSEWLVTRRTSNPEFGASVVEGFAANSDG